MVDQELQQFKGVKPAYTLGIDPALGKTGIAYYDGKNFQLFLIKTGSLRKAKRLTYIRKKVAEFIKRQPPTLVAIENYSYGSEGHLAQLGEAGGVIRQLLDEHEIPYFEVEPSLLKLAGTGRGSAGKEKVIAVTNARYNLDLGPKDDDMADAAVLAKMAHVFCTRTSPFRSELDAVYRVEEERKKRKKFKSIKNTL